MAGTLDDEQAKRSINEMFGDDDSDSDSDDQMRPVSTTTTADASGLFGSDSESDDDDEPKRAVAPPPSKKARTSSSAAASKQRRGKKKEPARAKARQEDSGDEYDSGEDVVRTKDDDDFIDQEDDLEDVLDEYGQDPQKFDDERPLPELDDHHQSKQEVDYFEETLRSLKTGRRSKLRLSVQEQEQVVQEVLYRMDKAQADDLLSVADRKPALEKIKFVDQAIHMLRKQQLQPLFLDFDLLSFIKKWIQPLEDGSLPNLGVRTKMLHIVAHLPVLKEHLKRSGFGKVVMTLWKHPDETPENKEMCRDLIERWSRTVFDKTLDYAKLAELEAEKAETMGFRRPERRSSPKESNLSRGDMSANPFLGRQPTEPKDPNAISQRAIMPGELKVDFIHRPLPKIDVQTVAQSKPAAALDTRKARLVKRMQEIARPGRKGKVSSTMKIEGR